MTKNKKLKGCLKGCGLSIIVSICLIIFFSILIAIIPENADKSYTKANSSYQKQNYEQAQIENNKALEKDSMNPSYHLLKAKISYELADYITSTNSFEKSINLAKNDSLRYKLKMNIADWTLQKGDTIQTEYLLLNSLNSFKAINYRNFTNTYLEISTKIYALGKIKNSLDILNALTDSLKAHCSDTTFITKTYYSISEKLLKFNDTIQSIKTLENLTREFPNSKLAIEKLGNYYYHKKQNLKAIEYYKNYLDIDTLNNNIYKMIGESYLNLNQKRNAIKYFKIATEKGNNDACLNLRELTAKTHYYSQSRCCDGTSSSSTGRGACSHHGGVCKTEYVPYLEYTINCR